MITLPTSSQLPPNRTREAPKADLRREITPWRALIWAFRDEAVRAASNHEYACGYVSAGYSMMMRAETGIGGGTINGLLEAHEDAITIDAKLQLWCGADAQLYRAIAEAAERARPVPVADEVPRLRIVPVLRANGDIRMEYPLSGSHKPYLCLVQYEGYTADQVERVRVVRSMFEGFLGIMPGFTLTKWRIVH